MRDASGISKGLFLRVTRIFTGGTIMRLLGIVIGLCFVLVSVTCFAQLDTATILGTISDTTGAVVIGARVEVQNTGTSATVQLTTDQNGRFVATALPVGSYRVSVTAPGFK